MTFNLSEETICAIATPSGIGAISIIRISGKKTFQIIERIFKPRSKKIIFSDLKPFSIIYGHLIFENEIIDEVLVSVFKTPNSYTGENCIEISCHGSIYIQHKILEILIKCGAVLAKPGEFTMRAFFNGKLDLSQAEAVADLISSSSQSAHKVAINQLRGGFSNDIKKLRTELLDFASLIELELDFSEEDVEFADRKKLNILIENIKNEVNKLINSYKLGNVIKTGIPVAIIGKTNVGKSTLLNAIINEDKAIVSEIPGTTRDSIEDTFVINGVIFRFIDTAGLRDSEDEIEQIGISRTYENIKKASIILYVVDIAETTVDEINNNIKDLKNIIADESKKIILVANKIDKLVDVPKGGKQLFEMETVFVSAKRKENIHLLSEVILKAVNLNVGNDETIVTNIRHYEALLNASDSILNIVKGVENGISGDLLSIDIHQTLYYLGEITGQVTVDEILENIFSKFCIGK
ncbi:MAG: tRNA uridine-5-carboxymethylaminomethyl(34) synthesis GTPase MnmE [Bacteroidetes bacterium GWA2_30_7]|nr:MAG: tRNA uridine-5-carboxymethylaminomethyl(34) synthesis GTPase MnmE [Bacteroidetes bacterium GWA2_30_7]